MSTNDLRELIRQHGYKMYEVAEGTDIPLRSLNDYCAGRFPIPHQRLETIKSFIGYSAPKSGQGERLKTWLVASIEVGTRLRWQLYYTCSNTLANDGLSEQIMTLETLADESGIEQTKTCRVLAQNYQLAGSLARDKFQYAAAKEYFHRALQTVDPSDFPDMRATAIARNAGTYLRQGQLKKALQLYKCASEVATHTEPHVKAYVLSGLAEALARDGQKDACYCTLDQAELLLNCIQNVPIEEDFAYVRLTQQSLEDTRGECYVLLGDIDKGLSYLRSAESILDQKMSRNHCRLCMQHSEAYLVAGLPDQCVKYALQGLQLARSLESVSNINWAYEMYQKLLRSAWSDEAMVKKLAEALKSEMGK